jgi:hypothetical protein
MDGGRKAHYFCPDGFELMLAGGGKEDCSGRCYRPGSADELKRAMKDTMQFSYETSITDVQATIAAEKYMKTGKVTLKTTEDNEIDFRKGKEEHK